MKHIHKTMKMEDESISNFDQLLLPWKLEKLERDIGIDLMMCPLIGTNEDEASEKLILVQMKSTRKNNIKNRSGLY